MNLLTYKNRFKPSTFAPKNIPEVMGYMWAMQDFLKYIEQLTEFNSSKRFIDSVSLLDTINETSEQLEPLMLKVKKQLQDELAGMENDPDDLKHIL